MTESAPAVRQVCVALGSDPDGGGPKGGSFTWGSCNPGIYILVGRAGDAGGRTIGGAATVEGLVNGDDRADGQPSSE